MIATSRRPKPARCGHCASVNGIHWERVEEEWACWQCGWRDNYQDDPLPLLRLREHSILKGAEGDFAFLL